MTDTSGPTCGKQFATYDPDLQSWRMWPATGLWGSIEYSETWPKTGYMSDGQAYELPTSVPPTTGNASSSSPHLPTPQAHDAVKGKTPEQVEAMRRRTGAGVRNLNEVAVNEIAAPPKVLPTPKAADGIMGRPRTTGRPIEKSTHLGTIVTLLPTPTASDGEKERNNPSQARRKSPPLSAVNHLLPTPEAKNAHAGPDYARKGRKKSGGDDLVTAITKLSTGAPTPPLFDVGSD